MYRVQRDLQLGEWKEVENFKISAEGGQYRPSKFQYKITIIRDTVIRRTDYRNENNFLSLSSYEDIGNGKCEAFFLIGMYTKRFSYCYLVTLYTYLILFSDLNRCYGSNGRSWRSENVSINNRGKQKESAVSFA